MRKKNIVQKLGNAPILPLLIQLTIPATTAQLVNALYSIVDRIFIGHLPEVGTIALSGIGLTFPITMLVSAFSYLPGMGGAPRASISIGEGDYRTAQKYLSNAVTMLLTISGLLTILVFIYMDPLLILFGANEVTLPYAKEYLSVYILGTVFIQLSLGLNPYINTQGYTTMGTMSVIIGALLNIILDPLFLFVLNTGIKGAALATVISQAVSCVWIITFLNSQKSSIHISISDMKPDMKIIHTTCSLGISPFTFRINESLVVIIMNRLIIIHGGLDTNLHLAAMAIINSAMQIFFMPSLGIVNGAQPILSYNYGSKDYSRIRNTIHYARILSFSCAIFMWIIFVFFPKKVCYLFTTDEQLICIAEKGMRITFCTIFSLGFQMINQNAFVAMGNSKYSFIFGIMRKLLILVPVAIILPHFIGIWGIYAAETVANPITTIITFIAFEKYMSNLKTALED